MLPPGSVLPAELKLTARGTSPPLLLAEATATGHGLPPAPKRWYPTR